MFNTLAAIVEKIIGWCIAVVIVFFISTSFTTIARCKLDFQDCSRGEAIEEFRDYLFEGDLNPYAWIGPTLLTQDDDSATYVWFTKDQVPDSVKVKITVKRCFFCSPDVSIEGRADKLVTNRKLRDCKLDFEICSYSNANNAFHNYLFEADLNPYVWVGPTLLRYDANSATYLWQTNNQVLDLVELRVTVKRCIFCSPDVFIRGRTDKLKLHLREKKPDSE